MSNIIYLIESQNELLVDCSNNIDGIWVLAWCRNYENNLINQYDCVNAVIDAKDGSVMLFSF